MRTVALFGGSFNPPHPAHFKMAKYLKEALGVDEVWFLYSVNWQKDAANYASLEQRMEWGRMIARHYPDMPFVMSDIENELGTHITYEVLTELTTRFPDTRFVWTMGADNLASFHTWRNFEYIIENHPIAIVDRPPYTEDARKSFTALSYAHLQADDPRALAETGTGWIFLNNPLIDMSSSNLLSRLRAGERVFEEEFQDVADDIRAKKLYGVGISEAVSRDEAKPEPGGE